MCFMGLFFSYSPLGIETYIIKIVQIIQRAKDVHNTNGHPTTTHYHHKLFGHFQMDHKRSLKLIELNDFKDLKLNCLMI